MHWNRGYRKTICQRIGSREHFTSKVCSWRVVYKPDGMICLGQLMLRLLGNNMPQKINERHSRAWLGRHAACKIIPFCHVFRIITGNIYWTVLPVFSNLSRLLYTSNILAIKIPKSLRTLMRLRLSKSVEWRVFYIDMWLN